MDDDISMGTVLCHCFMMLAVSEGQSSAMPDGCETNLKLCLIGRTYKSARTVSRTSICIDSALALHELKFMLISWG